MKIKDNYCLIEGRYFQLNVVDGKKCIIFTPAELKRLIKMERIDEANQIKYTINKQKKQEVKQNEN